MDISQIRGIILFISAFLGLFLVLIFWIREKSREVFLLSWPVLFSALYAFSNGALFFFAHNKLFWNRATWSGALIVPAYITFVYHFIGRTKYFALKSFLWYLGGIIILFFALATPYFTVSVSPEYPFKDVYGPLDPFGRIYVVVGVILALFHLLKKYFKSKGFRRWQLKYFILGIGIHSIGGLLAGGLIPLFYPKFTYVDISAFLTIPMVVLMTYAIFKQKLFGIRIILTEILVGAIAIILLVQAFLSETSSSKILGFFIFFPFLFVGYLLIRVTQKEIERKEEAEKLAQQLKELNETLENRVKERTQELEQSFQEIKKRKDELEGFYNLTVGRELKMIELKKEIQELKKKLGGNQLKNEKLRNFRT